MILIMAGTRRQAVDYAAKAGLAPHDWNYLYSASQLQGCPRGSRVVKIGTWRDNPELSRINAMLAVRECIVEIP